MASILPFKAIRPTKELASQVSSSPESGNRVNSKKIMDSNPNSYLHVVKPYLHFDDDHKIPEKHFAFGRKYLEKLIADGVLIRDEKPTYYIYRTIVGTNAYTGIIASASVEDYQNNVILKHENTLTEKQNELVEHIKYIKTIGSPVLVTYPDNKTIDELIHTITKEKPEYNFISDDQVKHNLWIIDTPERISLIQSEFENMKQLYIADGHHRSAGASAYCQYMKSLETQPEASYHYYPVCLIPFSKMKIYEYHRLIKDEQVHTTDFLNHIKEYFHVTPCGHLPFQPLEKGEFGIYIKGHAYQLELKKEFHTNELLNSLDVSIVETYILNKILHVSDSKTDPRLSFIDGSKGIGTIQHIIDEGSYDLAITLYPTSINELIQVADNQLIMPPKSTWIEPKIRTGLVVYEMD